MCSIPLDQYLYCIVPVWVGMRSLTCIFWILSFLQVIRGHYWKWAWQQKPQVGLYEYILKRADAIWLLVLSIIKQHHFNGRSWTHRTCRQQWFAIRLRREGESKKYDRQCYARRVSCLDDVVNDSRSAGLHRSARHNGQEFVHLSLDMSLIVVPQIGDELWYWNQCVLWSCRRRCQPED
jgi:hypothetical protein